MRYLLCVLLPTLMVITVVGCTRNTAAKQNEARIASSRVIVDPADNSRCHVCHGNYDEEELAVSHALAGVGCEKCHGECDAHCDDENNITPPDIMFSKEAVNSFCITCHKELTEKEEHEGVLAGTSEKKHCTDCHGEHRLAVRTQQWDKKTGKLMDAEKMP